MKKLLIIAVMLVSALGMSAQKFALIDMEYILKNIPASGLKPFKIGFLSIFVSSIS